MTNTFMAQKILMIRHAEKPVAGSLPNGVTADGVQDDHSLIVRGWQRAGALAMLLASDTPLPLARPQFVFAASGQTSAKSQRSKQTVMPLVTKLGNAVVASFDFGVGQELSVAEAIGQCAGVVLVAWEHHNIPIIASSFPLSSNNKAPVGLWPDDRFDLVWVFDQDASAPGSGYIFSQVAQLLLAGDQEV